MTLFFGGSTLIFHLQNYAFPFNLSIQSSGKLPILYKKRLPILSTDNLILYGAENETRTRDPNLGKVMLYQLSYFRSFLENGCKDKQFPRYSQTFHRKKLTK